MTPSPDPGFVRKLKEYSKGLKIVFSREHGLFKIMQKARISGWIDAFLIEPYVDGGHYRQPNDEDIKLLAQADRWRKGQEYKDALKKGEDYTRDAQQASMDEAEDTLKQATLEDKNQLINTYAKAFNTGKGVTGYRQTKPKQRGLTWGQIRKLRNKQTDQVSSA